MNKSNLNQIKKRLPQNCTMGSEIYYYENIPSTMITAKELACEGIPEGSVILAQTQSTGRGRLGRNWSSPQGGIWMSIVLRPSLPMEEIPLLTLAAGVCICHTIKELYGITPGLKWPNDVIINNKKVCGILTESCIYDCSAAFVITGIGVNLNFSRDELSEDLKPIASTLLSESGKYVKPEDFLVSFFTKFNEMYKDFAKHKSDIIKAWKEYSVIIGKEVYAIGKENTIEGTAKDITSEGSLVIETNDGSKIEVRSGEVSVRTKNSNYPRP